MYEEIRLAAGRLFTSVTQCRVLRTARPIPIRTHCRQSRTSQKLASVGRPCAGPAPSYVLAPTAPQRRSQPAISLCPGPVQGRLLAGAVNLRRASDPSSHSAPGLSSSAYIQYYRLYRCLAPGSPSRSCENMKLVAGRRGRVRSLSIPATQPPRRMQEAGPRGIKVPPRLTSDIARASPRFRRSDRPRSIPTDGRSTLDGRSSDDSRQCQVRELLACILL
ncbi:hypothetical protein OH76DRAFT_616127 [Lentinus brumalis]|uniref:Uncharacterized protein n=1 Tax=Lentinus brumalis TaxID=2498619 RepID=A0A371D8V7_9APHY|nr:hypothetical protein OH76DRAFT_616127 [Polyporus brumalis]